MKFTFFFISLFISFTLKAQTFLNVAPSQNVYDSYSDVYDLTGGGLSFFDFDNDGWDDLTFTHKNDSLVFYKNHQGNFIEFPLAVYDTGEAKNAVWADYDNDGLNDLFVTFFNGPLKLYRNLGNLIFDDITTQAGLAGLYGANHCISFSDYDRDGFLDMLIGRYSFLSDQTLNSEKNALYKNNGDGTFIDITANSGIDVGINQTLAAVWLDYNKDGWADIYVVTDRVQFDNNLFKNNGDGTFTDVAPFTGSLAINTHGMTNTVGDFDNDGDLDIYITNLGFGIDTCRFLVNNNNIDYTESALQYGVHNVESTWGSSWIDADNDGYLDLIVVSQIDNIDPRNFLYMNQNGIGFNDSPQNFQSYAVADSRSIANGDLNNDGRIDCAVYNTLGFESFIWQNTSTDGNHIKITLYGTISNKMAIGSWITVYANGHSYSHYTMCGENYLGQNSQHHIFGLDQATIVDSIIVNYQSGITDHYYSIDVNQSYDFYEGETSHNEIVYTSPLSFCTGDSVVLNGGNFGTHLWSDGSLQQYLTVTQTGNYWVDVTDSTGIIIPSDTILIYVASPPQISINAENISCAGQNNGSILLEIVNQTNDYTIVWNQGLQGDSLFNLSAGNYTFEYNDIYGCYYTDSIDILSPFAFLVTSQITPYSASGMGEIYSIINGGTPPYQIYLDGDFQGALIDSLLPGIYNYQVFDANGCSFSNTIEIIDNTSVGLTFKNTATYQFENPMYGNILHFYNASSIDEISVYNALGQLLPSQFENNILFIHDDYKGVIFLKIISQNKENHFKVLKL